jgi:hypothetical protein
MTMAPLISEYYAQSNVFDCPDEGSARIQNCTVLIIFCRQLVL